MMEQFVNLGPLRLVRRDYQSTDSDTGDRGKKGDQRHEQRTAVDHQRSEANSVDGASGFDGSKGDSDAAAAGADGSIPAVTPKVTAPSAATAISGAPNAASERRRS